MNWEMANASSKSTEGVKEKYRNNQTRKKSVGHSFREKNMHFPDRKLLREHAHQTICGGRHKSFMWHARVQLQQKWGVHPILSQCWANVKYDEPALGQHWINVLHLLRIP